MIDAMHHCATRGRWPIDRTGIYVYSDAQRSDAERGLASAQAAHGVPIATELKDAAVFWPAEMEHQDYLRNGGRFNAPQSIAKGCTDPIRCYG